MAKNCHYKINSFGGFFFFFFFPPNILMARKWECWAVLDLYENQKLCESFGSGICFFLKMGNS
jgi:hypothetical protein